MNEEKRLRRLIVIMIVCSLISLAAQVTALVIGLTGAS